MLYEENKDITYISRWMRITEKVSIKAMNMYNFWVRNRRNEQIMKINSQINRLQNIKGLIKVYIGLNRRKWVNTKGVLDFCKTLRLIDSNSGQFTYCELRKWLTEVLRYSWRKSNVRPPRSLRPGLDEDRIIFNDFISKLKKLNLWLFILTNDVL